MPEPAEKPSPQVEEPQAAAYDPGVAGVQAAQQLEQSGFERRQADAVVLAVRELAGDLATKSELQVAIAELEINLRGEIAGLESRLRGEIADLEIRLKGEIADLESRLRGEIADLESRLRGEIADLESKLRGEIADLGSSLRGEIASLGSSLRGEIASLDSRLSGEIIAIKKIMDTTMATKEDLAQMQLRQAKDAFRHTLWTVGIIVGTLLAGMGVATAVLIAVMMRLFAAA